MKKNRKNNVIPFPQKSTIQTQYTPYESFNDYDDFEDWEDDYWLLEEKKYKELIAYRKNKAEKRPNDPHAQYLLGDAYVLNKEYKKAIAFLSKAHKKWPDFPDVQHTILDALYAQRLSENDFEWIIKPEIIKLSGIVLDRCYEYLKPKKKPRSITELHIIFIMEGYVAFSEEELFAAFLKDDRFIIENSGDFFSAEVRVVRKKDLKNKKR